MHPNEINIKLDRILNELEFIKNRTSTYLGNKEVLSYLIDETPIFVNSNDSGCPINFMNGGAYEENYFTTLLSFRQPDLAFLDIGANLGYYSLRFSNYFRKNKIHAFEPNPRMRALFSKSAFLNGYSETITIHPYAVSDKDGVLFLSVPEDHAGGASLSASGDEANAETVDVKNLDEYLGSNFVCGLVKLDVEGHELHALRGMQSILERSKRCALIFEKLSPNSGIEDEMNDTLSRIGWSIYLIEGTKLRSVEISEFKHTGGYFIAAPLNYVEKDGLNRNFFDIFPSDLNVIEGEIQNQEFSYAGPLKSGSVIVHGPYWYLPKGYYRISLDASFDAPLTVDVCERFGYKVAEFTLNPKTFSHDVPIPRDLQKFELVIRSKNNTSARINIRKIRFSRIG